MLPSRGLLRSSPALGLARVSPRTISVRQFGTALRSNPASRLASLHSPLSSSRIGGAFAVAPTSQSILSSRFQTRYASTQPTEAAASPAASPAVAPATGAEFPEATAGFTDSFNLSASDLLSGSDLLNMPETIGFLKRFGLDYGWGPTAMLEWYVEHIYVWTGMPWWATIATAAIGLRLAIFKPSLDALVQQQKMNELRHNPRYQFLESEFKTKMALEGFAAAVPAQTEMGMIRKAMGLKMWKTMIPLVNIPISFGMFRLFRGMADLPVPSLENGGCLWFTDLSQSDPFFILPIVTTALVWKGMTVALPYMAPAQQKTIKIMAMIFMPLSLIFTVKLSAATQFYFLMTALLHMLQSTLFYQPWFRAIFGLGPPPAPGPPPSAQSNTVSWQPARGNVIDTTATPVKDDSYASTITSSFKSAKETLSTTLKDRTAKAEKSDHLKRAKEYEEKRALEEKEKQIARQEYRQMKKNRR